MVKNHKFSPMADIRFPLLLLTFIPFHSQATKPQQNPTPTHKSSRPKPVFSLHFYNLEPGNPSFQLVVLHPVQDEARKPSEEP
ncbi:hypothetical protein ACFX2I_014961 [Malus domestica]